jgi:hypothetical protein
MLIGLATRTLGALLPGTVCFLGTISYHGPPSVNILSRVLVPKLNTEVLPMQWLRLAGFANYSENFVVP